MPASLVLTIEYAVGLQQKIHATFIDIMIRAPTNAK